MQLGIECRERGRERGATGNLFYGTWHGKLCNWELCVGNVAEIAVLQGI